MVRSSTRCGDTKADEVTELFDRLLVHFKVVTRH
jgi:hypothetical protein